MNARKRSYKRSRAAEKRVDETLYLSGRRRGAILREEVWYEAGKVVKYNLAYINPRSCTSDNGRVLGYDNSHDYHHRHFMGQVEEVEFHGYEDLLLRFQREIEEIWRNEDEKH
jgi:Family of unknown function (DUF6516)